MSNFFYEQKAWSKIQLKPKALLKWVFMDIIPSIASTSLTTDTTFSNYIFIADTYSKISKLYGMEKIASEKVMDKMDTFKSRFGGIDQFGWWDL